MAPTFPEGTLDIPWVRKRDGSVVAFDTAKFVSSIFAARRQIDEEDAAFHAQEHSQAILHFLHQDLEGRIPTTEEIGETAVKVLRELGQGPTAAAYFDYRQRRRQLRERMRVHETAAPLRPDDAGPPPRLAPPGGPEAFDKARIAWALETDGDLDAATAREVAASVERRLLASGLGNVSTGLIRELTDAELMERGLNRSLSRRRFLGVPARVVEEMLAARPEPDEVYRWAGRELLRQYALQEVFSPDIAGLHDDGLIHLFNAACPIHWSAVSLDIRGVAGRSTGADSFLREFETELDQVCRRVEGAVAIDSPDAVLALLAERGDDPSRLADLVVDAFRRAVQRHHVYLAINLRGRVPDSLAQGLSEGPLFNHRPDETQDRFAARFSLRCSERVLEDAELASRARIDFHPDLGLRDEDLQLSLGQWARWARRHSQLCFTFDRESALLCEGISAIASGRTAVYQQVGIRLPSLHRRLGAGCDDETLFERLGLLCESAVRAGVQKREFLRRQHPDLFAGRDYNLASVVVVPIGLDAMVKAMLGKSVARDESAMAFATQILLRMRHRLQREGKHYQLRCKIDGMPGLLDLAHADGASGTEETSEEERVVGNTPAAPGVGPKQQLLAGGKLHAVIGAGTTFCRLANEDEIDPRQILDLILFAARQTTCSRVCFTFPTPARQAPLVEDWFG